MQALVAGGDRMACHGEAQLAAEHAIVDLSGIVVALISAEEIAQVAGQYAGAQRQGVQQAEEVLAVEVVELATEVAEPQPLVHRVVGARVSEVATLPAPAGKALTGPRDPRGHQRLPARERLVPTPGHPR